MLTKEQLIALGLTPEQADAVIKANKAAIDGNYVPKATFEEERGKVKTANDTIAERDKQIKELGAFKGTAEELDGKVKDLEKKNKEAADKYAADLAKTQTENTVKMAIMGSVVDVEDVMPKLDITKLTIVDGKITAGLTEQLDALKKSKPHYFKAEDPNKGGAFPKGFNIFGKTPPEGSEQHDDANKPNAAAEFGKQLAQFKTGGEVAAQKANDIYFK